jgi:3-hydroxyisobutyrate dehydrogenase-like beta-hydroxyacid dehydrogenase
MNVAFIGLGIMGTPMATNLVKAGHALQVFDLKPVPESLAGKGVSGCASSREATAYEEVMWMD